MKQLHIADIEQKMIWGVKLSPEEIIKLIRTKRINNLRKKRADLLKKNCLLANEYKKLLKKYEELEKENKKLIKEINILKEENSDLICSLYCDNSIVNEDSLTSFDVDLK